MNRNCCMVSLEEQGERIVPVSEVWEKLLHFW